MGKHINTKRFLHSTEGLERNVLFAALSLPLALTHMAYTTCMRMCGPLARNTTLTWRRRLHIPWSKGPRTSICLPLICHRFACPKDSDALVLGLNSSQYPMAKRSVQSRFYFPRPHPSWAPLIANIPEVPSSEVTMAYPSGLRLLFLFLVVAGLLESPAWARPSHPKEPGALLRRLIPLPKPLWRKYKPYSHLIEDKWTTANIQKDNAVAMEKDRLASNLNVTIMQISKDPLIIKVELKNNGTIPITFLNNSTPLDPDAFGLGLFHITTDKLPMLNFGNRVLPPRRISHSNMTFIEISPGMTIPDTTTIMAENFTLKKEWTRIMVVGDKIEMQMRGEWEGIWEGGRDRAERSIDIDGLHYHRRFPPFESNTIELKF